MIMRAFVLLLAVTTTMLPAHARDVAHYWNGVILERGRPANFYAAAFAQDGALCNAFARAAAPAAFVPLSSSRDIDATPHLAITTADIAWERNLGSHRYAGLHATFWAVLPASHGGTSRALIYTRWKGHRVLEAIDAEDGAHDLLTRLNTVFHGQSEEAQALLRVLQVATDLGPTVQRLNGQKLYEQLSFQHFNGVRLLGQPYLSLLMHAEYTSTTNYYQTRPWLLLAEFDAQNRATLRCALRGRFVVRMHY